MPEVQARLATAATWRALTLAERDRLPAHFTMAAWRRYCIATERLAADFDGALRDAAQIRAWVADWPSTFARIKMGTPPVAIGTWAGRAGRERTMTAGSIHLAARSLALRPKAREELNRMRAAGYRGCGQRGHEHSQKARAHGATRADELAALEAYGGHGKTAEDARRQVQTVTKARRDLKRILDELDGIAASKAGRARA